MNAKEEGFELKLDFSKLNAVSGVVPVAIQHADTKELLLIGYTNEEAMHRSFQQRRLILWSTSRNELWEKGASSGCRFELVAAFVNCEQNSLLYHVRPWPAGTTHGACHTRNADGSARSGCYYREIDFQTERLRHVHPTE